jgi:hypothetical protein
MNENRTVSFPNLKFPRQGKGGRVIFTQDEFANFASQILQAMRFLRVIVPTTDGTNVLDQTEALVEWAEEGVIITLPPQFNINTPISGGGGTASVSLLTVQITAIDGTNLTCIDGLGNNYTVQKPVELQDIGSEVIDGETITYTNYTNSFNDRTATDPNSNSEAQYITPRYVVGEQILIGQVTNFSGVGTYWLEVSPSRQWGGID